MESLRILEAKSFWQRLRGLMFYADFPAGCDGLLLEPCNAIHCFFMRFAIDAVFLDGDQRALKIATCRPWSVGPLVRGAQSVLELPAGKAAQCGYKTGLRIKFTKVSDPAPKS